MNRIKTKRHSIKAGLIKYTAIIIKAFQGQMTFRKNFLTQGPIHLLTLLLFYAFWKAVYSNTEIISGFSFKQMISYLLIAQIVKAFTAANADQIIGRRVAEGKEGSVSSELIMPVSYQLYIFSTSLGQLLIDAFSRAVIVLSVGIIFLGIQFPANPLAFLGFIASLFSALLIAFSFSYLWGLLYFWAQAFWGLNTAKTVLLDFFSGGLVPLTFFPGWFQSIANILPFKNIIYIPVSIYLERIPVDMIPKTILIQLIWAVIFWIVSGIVGKYAFKQLEVFGG